MKWPTLFPSGDVTGLNFWTVCPGFFRVREYENLAKKEVLTKKYEAHKRGKNARKHEKSKMKHQQSNNIIQTIFFGIRSISCTRYIRFVPWMFSFIKTSFVVKTFDNRDAPWNIEMPVAMCRALLMLPGKMRRQVADVHLRASG